MKRFLLALLALVSVASAEERQRVELVNISPSLWLKYDAGVSGSSGDPVSTWLDQSGAENLFLDSSDMSTVNWSPNRAAVGAAPTTFLPDGTTISTALLSFKYGI